MEDRTLGCTLLTFFPTWGTFDATQASPSWMNQ